MIANENGRGGDENSRYIVSFLDLLGAHVKSSGEVLSFFCGFMLRVFTQTPYLTSIWCWPMCVYANYVYANYVYWILCN